MLDNKDVTFNFKAVINKQKNKVLFAEVDNDFANALLSFMTLPLGRIVQVLRKHYGENNPLIGSLNTLYSGVENLDHSYFKSYDDHKLMLLDPISAYAPSFLNKKPGFGKAIGGNFIEDESSVIVSDDLQIEPVRLSIEKTIDKVGIAMADLDGAETRNVTFYVNEFMDLLKGSLISRNPLTDIILGAKWIDSTPKEFEPLISLYFVDEEIISNFEITDLIAVFEKSTNKFLFAYAQQDFVDFLFSLLLIPLGRVHSYLGTTGLNCVDNLNSGIGCYFDENVFYGSEEVSSWLNSYDTDSFFGRYSVGKFRV